MVVLFLGALARRLGTVTSPPRASVTLFHVRGPHHFTPDGVAFFHRSLLPGCMSLLLMFMYFVIILYHFFLSLLFCIYYFFLVTLFHVRAAA